MNEKLRIQLKCPIGDVRTCHDCNVQHRQMFTYYSILCKPMQDARPVNIKFWNNRVKRYFEHREKYHEET
jgi:hypothetical protein